MKRFVLIGLSLLPFINVSAQSSDEITDLRLSYEYLSVEVSDEFMGNLDDPAAILESFGDSVIVSTYFTVADLAGLQGITCQLTDGGEYLYSETYFPFEDYSSDNESSLYRDDKHFITELGKYSFFDNMLVKVKLEYDDRQTAYYSRSINE